MLGPDRLKVLPGLRTLHPLRIHSPSLNLQWGAKYKRLAYRATFRLPILGSATIGKPILHQDLILVQSSDFGFR